MPENLTDQPATRPPWPSWNTLLEKAELVKDSPLRSHFATSPSRGNDFTVQAAGLTANFSRQHWDDGIKSLLITLAKEAQVEDRIRDLFAGNNVNITENRPALHMALRGSAGNKEQQDQIRACNERMQMIAKQIRSKSWKGFRRTPITDVVSIGIGGSDLGPKMVVDALLPNQENPIRLHFVSNIDPSDLEGTLSSLTPATTLFIVASKSWTTLETLTNAKAARNWLKATAGENTDLGNHFIAISSKPERCLEFNIKEENVLPMWDWVGGRYSLWSAIGLPVAIALGWDKFEELLAGAKAMDLHFTSTSLEQNMPALMALLEVWYTNFWGCQSHAILPYCHRLRLFTDHMQQLIMESNGKSIDLQGNQITYPTCPVIWGAAGTNGQHSFHQLLHQGTQLIPVDFILPLNSGAQDKNQHQHMIANCLAQAEALMDGQQPSTEEEVSNTLTHHKFIPGNRPSTIITMKELSAKTLGALIALYEHRVFCSSVIWNINAFDQWGVELGKTISSTIYSAITNTGAISSINNPATKQALEDYSNNTTL